MMIAMTVGLIILAAIVSTSVLQRNSFDAQEQSSEIVQTARAALDMIILEAMMAGYDPNGALQRTDDSLPTFSGIVYDSEKLELEIRADLNGNKLIVSDAKGSINPESWTYDENERIVYKLIGNQLKRKTGSGGGFQPFAENIEGFAFEYLDDRGTCIEAYPVLERARNIRQLRISITAISGKPIINAGYKTTKASSLVKLRNMGLEKPEESTE